MSWSLQPTVLPGQVMTEMQYPIYAEGIHTSITRCRAYGIPIYITGALLLWGKGWGGVCCCWGLLGAC